jgi:hypothetical protein
MDGTNLRGGGMIHHRRHAPTLLRQGRAIA